MKQIYLLKKLLFALIFLLISAVSANAHSDETEALRFTENKGQWQPQIAYKADLQGGNLYLEKNCLTYSFYDMLKLNEMAHRRKDSTFVSDGIIQAHAFKVSFEGANPVPELTSAAAFTEYHNYYLGADESKWAAGVKRFGEVTWHNLYPGIDLKTYSSEGNFKYDFIVKPGSNPKKIQLKYEGLDKLYLQNGELHLVTSLNHLIEKAPYTYQVINGRKVTVASRFSLVKNVLQFDVFGKYDAALPLIIDPVLVFSTHSGSRSPVFGHTATYDLNGNTYAAGPCYGVGYPATIGAFQIRYTGQTPNPNYLNPDVAISKYSPDGKQLLYATYLGGTSNDFPHSLIVNNRNELLIMGTTASSDFPTGAGSFDRTYNGGGSDIFVTQFDSTGKVLIGSTFMGGSSTDGNTASSLMFYYGDDYRGDIQIDADNNCYIASGTFSTNFPVHRAFQAQHNSPGRQDAVVFKLNDNLSSLVWSTYYGSAEDDAAFSLTLKPKAALGQDLVYVTGAARASLGLFDNYQPVNAGGKDGFVVAFNQNFDTSQFLSLYAATNLGTAGDDRAYFVQIGPDGDVYVLGGTTGNYPVSQGVYSHPNGSVFIQKLSADLKTGIWSTKLGYQATRASTGRPKGTEGLSPTAFLVDDCGFVYFTGWGRTPGLPVTPDALQATPRRDDLYLAVLSPNAVSLEYATYMGGISSSTGGTDDEEHVDGGTSRFDKNGTVYQAVCTNAHSFPTTVGAVFPTNQVVNNAYDEAVFKLKFEIEPIRAFVSASPNASGEAPFTVNFSNIVNGSSNLTLDWAFGDGNTSQQSNPANTYTSPGTYQVRLVAVDPVLCGGRDTVYLTIRVYANDSTDYHSYSVCRGDSVQFGFSSVAPISWSPAAGLSDATIPNPFANPDQTTTYTANIQTSPTAKVQKHVTVTVLEPSIASFSARPFCYPNRNEVQFTTPLLATEAKWHFGDGDSSSVLNPKHSYAEPGTYLVTFSGKNINGCKFYTQQPVTVDVLKIPNIFTPNGDNLNETFVINCLPAGQTTLEVYNRWGSKVYDSGENNYQNNWDGKNLPDGVYYYYVRFADTNTSYKGWVEIVR